LLNNEAYADKREAALQAQGLTLLTPVKKQKHQAFLDATDQWPSTAVSRVRQPIESLFNWIEQKTGIPQACLALNSH
jgi:hypothetical protein